MLQQENHNQDPVKVYKPIIGPKGVALRIEGHRAHIRGSEHWHHWLHHILPGVRRREIACGELIAARLDHEGVTDVSGHSLGGCLAQIAAKKLGIPEPTTWGTKQPPRGYECPGKHYRHRFDPVPLLIPWRRKVLTIIIGRPTWP